MSDDTLIEKLLKSKKDTSDSTIPYIHHFNEGIEHCVRIIRDYQPSEIPVISADQAGSDLNEAINLCIAEANRWKNHDSKTGIHWRDVAARLRGVELAVKALRAPKRESGGEPMTDTEYHQKVIQMTKDAVYIDGIPERGSGKRFGETVVNNILGYVKFLEAAVIGYGEPVATETLRKYLKRNSIEALEGK